MHRNWPAIARRVKDAEGGWILVAVTKRHDRGLAKETKERLRGVGCKAQVVALFGLEGKMTSGTMNPRPWEGFAIFARLVPDYVKSDRLIDTGDFQIRARPR